MESSFDSDPFLKPDPPQKKALLTLEQLPDIILAYIFLYLDSKTLLIGIANLNTFFNSFLKTKQNLRERIVSRHFGFDEILKKPFINNMLQKIKRNSNEIPFYPYKTDGGFDMNKTEYWINRVFTKGNWNVCSKEVPKLNIIGGLIENRGEMRVCMELIREFHFNFKEKNLWEKVTACFKRRNYNFQIDFESSNPFYEKLLSMLFQDRKSLLSIIYDNQKYLEERVENFEFNDDYIENYLNDVQKFLYFPSASLKFDSITEVSESNITISDSKIALINGIEINRHGNFTCPVKTLMIFTCQKPEISDNEIKEKTSIYDNWKSHEELIKQLESSDLLVNETNMKSFHSFAKKKVNPSQNYNYLIFSNSNKGTVKPLVWAQFSTFNFPKIDLILGKDNFFPANRVLLKMIDCEDLRGIYMDLNQQTNIDINHVSFGGFVIDKNEIPFSFI